MGFLDRLFGRRGQRGSSTRDDSSQPIQTPIQDSSGGQPESHHHGGDQPGQQDVGPASQDIQIDPSQSGDLAGGDPGGGDAGGGGDSGGGGGDGGGGNGGGGGD